MGRGDGVWVAPDAIDTPSKRRENERSPQHAQAGQKTGGKCEVALKWHVPASRDLATAVLGEAQTRTRPPRDTLDGVERAAPHADRDTPEIEGRLKLDFHAGRAASEGR